jgi:hypothetical protein
MARPVDDQFIKHLWNSNKITIDEAKVLYGWMNTIEAQQQEIERLNKITANLKGSLGKAQEVWEKDGLEELGVVLTQNR